jgi:hypothetical protein
MKHHSRELKRVINEGFEEDIHNAITQEQVAILTFDEIVDIVMLTVAALKSEKVFIAESQKGKDKRRIFPKRDYCPNYTSPKYRIGVRR